VRAIFGFPFQVGAIRLGALNLYRDRPGPLSDDQHADALVMAMLPRRPSSFSKPMHQMGSWPRRSRRALISST